SLQQVRTGKTLAGEFNVIFPSGKRILEVKTDPLKVNEKVVGFHAVLRDTTDRKKSEAALKESNEKLESLNDKLRVIGSLTRHDVKNKLMVIKGNIYLLKKMIGENSGYIKYLNNVESALDDVDHLFEISRIFEKTGSEQTSELNVGRCFDDAVSSFKELSFIQIINKCHELTVHADSMLRQVLYNLLDNSLRHGKVVTKISLNFSENEAGTTLVYEDDGVGIPTDFKSKIFTVGFTTGSGSGYGLPLIKRIIESYGWKIQEISEPGKGAKFEILIPDNKQKQNNIPGE
ncbi:MAG: hypothetical protein GX638_05245, partial [Crenarchaeota archaeon]|nr:hypothetical protein [Thermoproteota archaeon]